MSERTDHGVDGLDEYLERFMSYPRTVRTDVEAVTRRRRPLRSRVAAPAGLVLLTAALVAALALALVHHQQTGGASGKNYKGKQLDIVLRSVTGSGTTTTKVGSFPYARYTFFADADPATCLRGVQLQDPAGRYIAGDHVPYTPTPGVAPGALNIALIQTNVRAGDYRVQVWTWAQPCQWRLQEILNSMSSDQAPPQAEAAPAAPPFDATVSSADLQPTIDVPVTGAYEVSLNYTPRPGIASCAVTHGFLVNSAGQSDPVLASERAPMSLPQGKTGSLEFLGAGERTVRVDTPCSWVLEVTPWLGPTGGGTQAFATPEPSPGIQ